MRRLAVMAVPRQEPVLDQMPHKYRRQENKKNAEQKKNRRVKICDSEEDHGLQDGPMNNIDTIREISKFREVAEIAPKTEDKNEPRNPENVEYASRDKMVKNKQASCYAGNAA
jgi:hypothetical protein